MADLDGDGNLDLVNGRYSPAIVYWFRGLGPGKGFGARTVLFDDTKDGKYSMVTANTADLDGDGDLDLLLGDTSGAVYQVQNVGSKTAPKFERRSPLRIGADALRVCHKSDPIAVDWDGDGVLDLLVGAEVADVSFFRGCKDGTFAPGVSLFSGLAVDPKDGYREAKAKFEPHRVIPGYRLRLATADWNGDGKLDLLVGNCEETTVPAGVDGKIVRGDTTGHVFVFLRR